MAISRQDYRSYGNNSPKYAGANPAYLSNTDTTPMYYGDTGTGMSPAQWGALGIGGGALARNLFTSGPQFSNPADAARPYLDKIPGTMEPYYKPYIDQGQRAGGQLESQYNSMTRDPAAFLASIGQNYKQSPGYQFALQQALAGSNNAAAAGGLLGSPANAQTNQATAEGLAAKDYEDWLNHALNIFGLGQAGLQDFEKQGYGASTDYGTSLANALQNRASLEAESAAERNKYNQAQSEAKSKAWGDVGALAMKALPYLVGA